MSKEERIALVILALSLVAILIWHIKKPVETVSAPTSVVGEVGISQTTENSSVAKGPAYLTYNSPWMFAPPIGNFMPSLTMGQIGEVAQMPRSRSGKSL